MQVIVATDGSPQSLSAARHLTSFADPAKISDVRVVAVIRPLASVAFADEISEDERTYRANTPLLLVGLVGNLAILGFSIYDDPSSLLWCAGLIAIGVVLFLIEYAFGTRNRPAGTMRGDPEATSRPDA